MGSRLYSNRVPEIRRRPKGSKPKAFKSEESANKWATEHNIKDYTLKNLRDEGKKKKIKIITV
jgi:hypothetical protein